VLQSWCAYDPAGPSGKSAAQLTNTDSSMRLLRVFVLALLSFLTLGLTFAVAQSARRFPSDLPPQLVYGPYNGPDSKPERLAII
jgi:hypothetical protein